MKKKCIRVNLKRKNLLKKFIMATIINPLLQQNRDRHKS